MLLQDEVKGMTNRKACRQYPYAARGIGLIEVLIAVFLLAFGVLAVSSLQSDFLSSGASNKAKTQAIAIAQSRLEDMRNYMNQAVTIDEFNTLYAVAANTNSATIAGVNRTFTRTETITANGDLRSVSVTVAWDDPANSGQSVTLNTDLKFISPRGPGDLAVTKEGSSIITPTGRAKRGEGVPTGTRSKDNEDGTLLYEQEGDLQLVYDGKIVLTLKEACDTDGDNCTSFVKIKGRVYIDTVEQRNLDPADVFVHASEAAFCSRYFLDDGNVITVGTDGHDAPMTANDDYQYFDYTCYLGGGWHGNIGILKSGGVAQSDKVCLGDPVSANAWEAPVIALRRAYRGMIYETDGSGNPVTNADNDIIYSSHGIADATELPDPATGDHTHDFVISSMAVSQTAGSNCISEGVMVRSDSNIRGINGDLFEGNPEDFFCLNGGYLDRYDSYDPENPNDPNKYGANTTCPYDPTNPPVSRHVVEGYVTATEESYESIGGVNTSDGTGNCLLTPFNTDTYTARYECDVYDWGSGWTGNIYTTFKEGQELTTSCIPNPLTLANVGDDDDTDNDISCSSATLAQISGSVTTSNATRVLESAVISEGSCTVDSDGLSYSCTTDDYTDTGNWDGSITFTATNGYICANSGIVDPDSPDTSIITLGEGSGSANATVTDIIGVNQLNIDISNNSSGCP